MLKLLSSIFRRRRAPQMPTLAPRPGPTVYDRVVGIPIIDGIKHPHLEDDPSWEPFAAHAIMAQTGMRQAMTTTVILWRHRWSATGSPALPWDEKEGES